jgi:hypothetical protein
MSIKYRIGIIIGLIGLLYLGCRPETQTFRLKDDRGWVEDLKAEVLDYQSVRLEAKLSLGKDAVLDSAGFEIGTSDQFKEGVRILNVKPINDKLIYNESGLNPVRQYFVRAFVKTGLIKKYSSTINFTTKDQTPPVIVTLPVSDITFSACTVGADIQSLSGLPLLEYGYLFNAGETVPTVGNALITEVINNPDTALTGIVNRAISGLVFNQTYTCVAYARNSKGISYGGAVTFTTQPYPIARVQTGNVSGLTPSSAVIVNNTIEANGASITGMSLLIGTQQPPEESNSQLISGDVQTGNSNAYDVSVSGLSAGTTYYYRARIQTPAGFEYGQVKAFTTGVGR